MKQKQRSFFDFDPQEVEREIQVRAPERGMKMRPYQAEAVREVFRHWEEGDTSTLVCLATGLGKTVLFSEVMRQWSEANQ